MSRIVPYLVLLASLFMSGANAEEKYIPSVETSQTTVNGIRIDNTEADIYKILGKPDKVIDHGIEEVMGGKAKTVYYSQLKIYLIDGDIYALVCKGKTCVTDKGIRIGDDRQAIEKSYGAPREYDKKGDRIGYAFRVNKTYIDSSLIFFLKDNKVIRIVYHVDYT